MVGSSPVVDAFALPVPGQGPDRLAAGPADQAWRPDLLGCSLSISSRRATRRTGLSTWCLLGELECDVSAQRGLYSGAVASPGAAGRTPGIAQDPDNVLPTPWHLGTSRTSRLAAWYRAGLPGRGQGDQPPVGRP